MNYSFPQRDWELLSAYLDQALTEQQMKALQQRLAGDEQLQRALRRLERTRELLRLAPQRRVPRSFVLNPSMVPAKAGIRWPFSLGTLSMATSLLLVIVLVGDFALYRAPAGLLPGGDAPAAEAFEAPLALEAPSEKEDGAGVEGESPEPASSSPAPDEEEQFDLFASQEEAESLAVDSAAQMRGESFDTAKLLRWTELALALLAVFSGLEAWRRRKA